MSDEYSEEQLESVLRTTHEWHLAFETSRNFGLLSEFQKAESGAIVEFFARYTYEYSGLAPKKWNEAALRECLTDVLPRKVSAEPAFFASIAPVLGGFFTFLEERGLLARGRELGATAESLHQAVIVAAADRRNWGPAKSLVMAAQDAGVDIRDAKALKAFMQEFNLRRMAAQAKVSGPIPTEPPGQPARESKPRPAWANVGPYEPCPCGSGRKFKFCCKSNSLNGTQGGHPEAEQTKPKWSQPDAAEERHFIAELRPDLDDEVDQVLRQLESGAGKAVEGRVRSLLQAHPRYHMTQYAMGTYLAVVENNPRAALPFFEKAVEIFPPFAEGHFNLGLAAMKILAIPKAVAGFRAAERYSSKDDGIAAMARGQLSFMERTLLKGTVFKDLDAYLANATLFDTAFRCLAAFQFDQAIEKFKRVLDVFPDHVQSYGNLALAYAGLGRKSAAMECLGKALALDPSYEPARANRLTIAAMREGEPFIPGGIREVSYYADRLREHQSRAGT